LLGVKNTTLQAFGAVSEETAREMAEGALQHSEAQLSLAITGIAGPTGGTAEKPVGTVWFGRAGIDVETQVICKIFTGNRQQVREQAIQAALEILILST
jgi:nicotinamide-nucleotide amidase